MSEHTPGPRLIAAAPDMLAALRHAEFSLMCIPESLDESEIAHQNLNMVRAAISKAANSIEAQEPVAHGNPDEQV